MSNISRRLQFLTGSGGQRSAFSGDQQQNPRGRQEAASEEGRVGCRKGSSPEGGHAQEQHLQRTGHGTELARVREASG